MRRSEWIAAGYFVYLMLPILIGLGRGRRAWLLAAAAALGLAVVGLSRLPGVPPYTVVRDWAPGAYLLAGYWLSGRLFKGPDERLERWLLRLDARLLGRRLASGTRDLPRAVADPLELAYLACYPLVPAAYAVVYFAGGIPGAQADDFWAAVLLAVFLCYGLLPWLPTRPPRAFGVEGPRQAGAVRRLNLSVLHRASIQVNTFPSGHVAAAVAAALAVGQLLPLAGAAIGVLAIAIAAGAVVGRYHYAADVVLGAIVAAAAFAVTRAGASQ